MLQTWTDVAGINQPTIMNCSFVDSNRSYPCGPSPMQRYGTKIVPLLSCQQDLKMYLSSLGLPSAPQVIEHEMILNQAGMFDTDLQTKNTLTVCPMHRYLLTVKWDGARHSRCAYPTHKGHKSLAREEEAGMCLVSFRKKMANFKWSVLYMSSIHAPRIGLP